MCGFAGHYIKNGYPGDIEELRAHMDKALYRRGPDSNGIWYSDSKEVMLFHRRLRVLGLDECGAQPALSRNGRYAIAYNGEVYNYREIARDLSLDYEAFNDTTVILEAVSRWGLQRAIEKFNGMFSFALYDLQKGEISLVRDRIGVKPLYYYYDNSSFVFGSDLRAITCNNVVRNDLDNVSINSVLRYGYVIGERSIYKHIKKVPPGTVARFRFDDMQLQIFKYWDLSAIRDQQRRQDLIHNVDRAVSELNSLVRSAVSLRMVSDVPIGAFLSGGIDSSLVASMMTNLHGKDHGVKTFSIGFDSSAFDETVEAEAVASYLKTEHKSFRMGKDDLLSELQPMVTIADEPLADPSMVPLYMISKLAKSEVTVCLSGDGGDEFFGGYSRYMRATNVWQLINKLNATSRQRAGKLASFISGTIGKRYRTSQLLLASDFSSFYEEFNALWGVGDKNDLFQSWSNHANTDYSEMDQMMMFDSNIYLPDNVLAKLDRATMFASLEGREPIKHWNGKGKWILRKLLSQYLPNEIVDRPKKGFAVPISSWLRTHLKSWAIDGIKYLESRNDFKHLVPELIKAWNQHSRGQRDRGPYLWNAVILAKWLAENDENA